MDPIGGVGYKDGNKSGVHRVGHYPQLLHTCLMTGWDEQSLREGKAGRVRQIWSSEAKQVKVIYIEVEFKIGLLSPIPTQDSLQVR